MREALNKARASAMEGSFGNEKLHYNAHRIKAKTQATETLWIYMAIWTASAQKIAHRITKEKRRQTSGVVHAPSGALSPPLPSAAQGPLFYGPV